MTDRIHDATDHAALYDITISVVTADDPRHREIVGGPHDQIGLQGIEFYQCHGRRPYA